MKCVTCFIENGFYYIILYHSIIYPSYPFMCCPLSLYLLPLELQKEILSWIPIWERWGWSTTFLLKWKRQIVYPRNRQQYWTRPLSYYGRPRSFSHPSSPPLFLYIHKKLPLYLHRLWMTCGFGNELNFIYEYECRFRPSTIRGTLWNQWNQWNWGKVEFRQQEYSYHQLWVSCYWSILWNNEADALQRQTQYDVFSNISSWIESSFPENSVVVEKDYQHLSLYWVMFSQISYPKGQEEQQKKDGWEGFAQLISRFRSLFVQASIFPFAE